MIVGGGPGCVSDVPAEKSPVEKRIEDAVLGLMPEVVGRDVPFLGCCYGIGILGHFLGAPVGKGRYGEPVGAVACRVTEDGRADPLLAGMPERFNALVGAQGGGGGAAGGLRAAGRLRPCPFQMIRRGRNVYATQFHPEADADGFALRMRVYRTTAISRRRTRRGWRRRCGRRTWRGGAGSCATSWRAIGGERNCQGLDGLSGDCSRAG